MAMMNVIFTQDGTDHTQNFSNPTPIPQVAGIIYPRLEGGGVGGGVGDGLEQWSPQGTAPNSTPIPQVAGIIDPRLEGGGVGGGVGDGLEQWPPQGTAPNQQEALILVSIAGLGALLNLLVIALVVSRWSMRKMTSAFIFHGCVLDLLKCAYCVPFANSLLRARAPQMCTQLGAAYVIIVTASGFNLLAMVCSEAYTFSERNIGASGRGSGACVLFGLLIVYIGSIIIHLGPTIIGGEFNYNNPIGNCMFVYGTIKSYVVHSMWIIMMTVALTGAVYYTVRLYRYVQAHSSHRLAALVRASIHISGGDASDYNYSVQAIVTAARMRTQVLLVITLVFIAFWYPLFILTLVDPHFTRPVRLYRLLTLLACSQAAVSPMLYLCFDRHITPLKPCVCCCYRDRRNGQSEIEVEYALPGRAAQAHGSALTPGVLYQRVGCRLCRSEHTVECNGGATTLNHASSMNRLQEEP